MKRILLQTILLLIIIGFILGYSWYKNREIAYLQSRISVMTEDFSRLRQHLKEVESGIQIESGGELKEIPGFRVQIFVSRDEFETRQIEEQALMSFDESVYLIFDSPNYKIRVGDCRSRSEANELRQRAVGLGYKDAWVVQCKVLTTVR